MPRDQRPSLEVRLGKLALGLCSDSITRVEADAIVNASSSRLILGAGVSGAIRRAVRDPEGLQAAMLRHAPLDADDALVTSSFGLPGARWIIHVASASGVEAEVSSALRAALAACHERGIAHLALPALGTGTGGLSVETCARLTLEAIAEHVTEGATTLERIDIVVFEGRDFPAFAEAIRAVVRS